MRIKVKVFDPICKISVCKKGEWVDLKARYYVWKGGPMVPISKTPPSTIPGLLINTALIPLGVAVKLPKYFEANILPRSSTFSNFGIMLANGMGIIDSSYSGNKDEWKFNAIIFRECYIEPGDRIAQFRIRPSQFAPWWVKVRWLFVNKIKFDFVEDLKSPDRGGFGSTGIK